MLSSNDFRQRIPAVTEMRMAAAFIAGHRKNVMRGLSYNAENALYNGVPVLGYTGKENEKYQIDPETAPIVKMIYKEYASGVPMQKICNVLKAQGMKSKKGNDFSINSLRHILTNPAYIGIYKWGDYTIEGGMPRIIDDELFEKAQKRLKENQRGGKGAVRRAERERQRFRNKIKAPRHACRSEGESEKILRRRDGLLP